MNSDQTRAILNDEVSQGRNVARIKNQFLDEFFQDKEKQIFELIKSLPIGSRDELVDVHHQLKSLNALQVEVQTVMDSAKLAKHQLLDESQ